MLRAFLRYRSGLREFLRRPLPRAEAYAQLQRQLDERQESFLLILEHAVFDQERSPYRRLLLHAGFSYEDIRDRVHQVGLEALLGELFDAGVFVTLDEFKGKRDIERPGLHFRVSQSDFDNPLLKGHFEGQTGGTRSGGKRIIIDFDTLTHESSYTHRLMESFDLGGRPIGFWRILPPGVAAIKMMFRYLKTGRRVDKWFTPSPFFQWPDTFIRYPKHRAFLAYSLYASRRAGNGIPIPQYVPYSNAQLIARWLEEQRSRGRPAAFDTTPSAAVRICRAAMRDGIDISGTFFQVGGEPLTEEKHKFIRQTGSQAVTYYSMAELGRIAMPCAKPSCSDDTHFLTDKLAVLQRPPRSGFDSSLDGLFYTTVLPNCPKLMLNVESGDYATLEERSCGCPWGEAGFSWHMSEIRSYEKLTTEGMCFLGVDVIDLVEKTLPRKFGGCSTDYQLLERVSEGLSTLSIVVSPEIGEIDEADVVHTAIQDLRKRSGPMALMTRLVASGNNIRVLRRQPFTTNAGKTFPIHIEH